MSGDGRILYETWISEEDHKIYDALKVLLYEKRVIPRNTRGCLVEFALRFLAVSILRSDPEVLKEVERRVRGG